MIDPEVKLTLNQVQRYETCKALLEGRLTTDEAALALGLSPRQVQRLKRRLVANGPRGLIHGNTARPPANKTPDQLKQQVLDLATTTYAHVNFSHLADLLAEEHAIFLSDETLRRWLRPLGHGRPPRRGKHRRRRTRRSREGELLFLDGSPHPWFGPRHPPCCSPATMPRANRSGANSSPRKTATAASRSVTTSSSASACRAPSTSTAPASSSPPATAASRPCTTPTGSRPTSRRP